MQLALANLDTGMFFGKSGWTLDHQIAKIFPTTETVSELAAQQNVSHPAAVLLYGDPLRVGGFLWITQAPQAPG